MSNGNAAYQGSDVARKACKLLGIRHIGARGRVLKSGTTPFPVEAPGAKPYLPSLNRSDPPDAILEFSNLAFLRRLAHEALIKHAVLCRRPRSGASFLRVLELRARNP